MLTPHQLRKLCTAICEVMVEYMKALKIWEIENKARREKSGKPRVPTTAVGQLGSRGVISLTLLAKSDFLAVIKRLEECAGADPDKEGLRQECVDALLMNQLLGSSFF